MVLLTPGNSQELLPFPLPSLFSAQLEKIRLNLTVLSMLLAKLVHVISPWLLSTTPMPWEVRSILTRMAEMTLPASGPGRAHGFISQKNEGIQHKLLQFCSSPTPYLPLLATWWLWQRKYYPCSYTKPTIHLYIWSHHPASSGILFPKLFPTCWSQNEQQTFLSAFYPLKLPPYPIPLVSKLIEKCIFSYYLGSSAVSHSSDPCLLTCAFCPQCFLQRLINSKYFPLILLQKSPCLRKPYPSLKAHLKSPSSLNLL